MGAIENGRTTVTLSSGATLPATLAEGYVPNGPATIVVRPEHARAVREGGDLRGQVENIVYFGTDTHIHVRLDDRNLFTVRQQNSRSRDCGFVVGDAVGVAIAPDGAQVLKD